MTASALILAANTGAVTVESVLLNLGLPGIVILALGWYARSAIKAGEEREQRLGEDKRRLEDDNRRLYQLVADQFMPALTKATSAVTDATILMAEIRKREEINAAVEASRRANP